MKAAVHILSLRKIPTKDVFRAECSCNSWSRLAYPRSRCNELHRRHLNEVIGEALKQPFVPEPHMLLNTEGE
jgi:hypothetical protein